MRGFLKFQILRNSRAIDHSKTGNYESTSDLLMDIDAMRLLFDAGLVVLIWMVQLIVYPSFLYYDREDLITWHKTYTSRLAMIVIPLLFGQLILAVIQLAYISSTQTIVSLGLVILVWISTFTQFVPIHNAIAKRRVTTELLTKLVRRNWIRTALWTFIFCWSLYHYI